MHKFLHRQHLLCSVGAILFLAPVQNFAFNLTPTGKEKGKTDWTVNNNFEKKVFIENKGQFDGKTPVIGEKIFYSTRNKGVDIYFTAKGPTYRHDQYPKLNEDERHELKNEKELAKEEAMRQAALTPVITYLEGEWVGANPNVEVTAEDEKSFYYTYPDEHKGTWKAAAFSKIIYHNLYPNVDVEYIIPENKDGIKYTIILHPGADLTRVKLKYAGDKMKINSSGDVVIKSAMGEFIDHAPSANYESETAALTSSFSLNGNTISFSVKGGYDASKTLIIDPWTSNPLFVGFNSAYDVESDNNGCVYIYGSYNPFQLQKYNSAGALLWTYNATPISGTYYGDLGVDQVTGSTYLIEGWNAGIGGARVIKVNNAGVQAGLFPGNPTYSEMWRIDYDPCSQKIVIGGGGTSGTEQAYVLDTLLTTITPVNSIGTTDNGYHDITFLTMDPAGGFTYMATTRSLLWATFNNTMFKVPVPALAPAVFLVPDGYAIGEFTSLTYVNNTSGFNGFNGMACSFNFLYTFDGATLKKWNKTTGALIASVATGGTSFISGGLCVDACDNIYVGVGSTVKVYNSALTVTSTMAATNTIYDLKLGVNNKLHACGIGFVQQFDLSTVVALVLTTSVVPAGCSCTGSATAATTLCGNPAAVTYSWSPGGQTTATITNQCPGTYTVFASAGCAAPPVSATAIITGSVGGLTVTTTQINEPCFSNTAASATASVVGGTAPYTYSWTPSGGTAATASALAAGTYTCTVHDAGGCTGSAVVTITQPTALAVTFTQTNITCNAACTGTATVTVTGGTAPYTYSWTPAGGTLPTASALCAGTYTCTIHDAHGCVITQLVTITQPPALVVTSTQINVSCFGGCNGSTTVTVTGGTGAYTYAWTPVGGTLATASALCAGTYTCTIHDANGCVITKVVTITAPPALAVTFTQVNENCFGGCTGSATVTVTGGTGAYTYAWTPTGGTLATASALCAGTYTCTMHDANGCVITQVVTITQPTAVTATATNTGATCGNANGTATATGAGGTGPYNYSWNPTAQLTQTATALLAGTYTCTVTDAHGCTTTVVTVISNAGGPTATMGAPVNVTCFGGNNGSGTVTVTGGAAPYTYTWSPAPGGGQGTATATGLTAGTYTVTVRDNNGCTTTATLTITQPPAFTVAITASVNVSCFGGNNGSATSTVTGGTGPFTYAWTPSGGTGAIGTVLTAGTFTVTATDAHGCTATATIVITQPPVLAATNTQVNENCNGGTNGSATVTATGGTGPYAYNWAPAPGGGQGTATATGLAAGTYTCTITDAHGCTTTSTVTITQPTPVTATATTVGSTCGNANGSATATGAGGTGPYGYSWNPTAQLTQTATALLAGSYTCTVTDAHGCTTTVIATVVNAGGPSATMGAPVNVSCFGGNNGSGTVTVTGGAAPYTYTWAPAPGGGQGTPTATGLTAGTYTVTVRDNNGCTTTAVLTITQPPVLVVTIPTSVNVSCFGGNNGSATSSVTGGTGPYAYNWTPTGGTGIIGTTLIAGTYTVTVTDAHGCTATANITITQPTQLTATNSQTNVSCNGGTNGTASVVASNATPPYAYNWAPAPGGGQGTANATGLAAGTYVCTITDAHGCSITSTVTITQPTPLTATATNVGTTCGNANGSATATGAGGTGPYGYSWNPSAQLTQTATALSATTYTCTVTDAHGCTTTVLTTLTNAGGPTATMGAPVNVSCFGGNNGSGTVTVTGGAAPYTYVWAPAPGGGQGTPTATGLTAGTYTVTVTDNNGCITTSVLTITQPPVLAVTIPTSTNVSCFGGNNGSATSAPTGGTGPYAYAWAPTGGTGITGTALSAGTYTVTVTDAHGCTATANITITQPLQLAATNTQTNVSCNGGSNGTATITATNGTGPYAYNWAPAPGGGQGTANATGMSIGTYVCTITDAHGCTITSSVTITQPPPLVLTMSTVAAHCGQADGSASVTVTGGTGVYLYLWTPAPGTGQGTPNAGGYIPGNVTVSVTDANRCTASNSILVPNVPGVVATNVTTVNVSCFGGNNGKDSIHASAGAPPYTYVWTPAPGGGQGTNVATGLSAGNYSCLVTDSAGCTSTVNVVVTQPTLLTVVPMGHVTICIGSCTPLTATGAGGTPAYTFAWTNGVGPVTSPVCPVVTTTYTVVCTDSHGCVSAPGTVTVTVNPPLEITAAGAASVCPGGSVPLTCTPSGGNGTYFYNWLPAATLVNATTQSPTATPAVTTTYTVILTDGCTTPADSATVTVTIFPTPVPQITSPDTAGCAAWTVNFNGTSVPACATANWQFGDGGIASGCGAQTHTYLNAGSYSVTITVTDINGCVGTLVKPNWITVYPVPEAAFTATPQPTTILASDITFTNHSTGAVTYNWNFGDISNASSTLMSPHYAYQDTGCYTVTLIVKNSFGCSDTATSPICIAPDFTFFAPNAFTPNGDGKNELWTPQGVGIDPNTYNLMMFDRWGNLIWYTTTWGQGWDGRANNGSDIAQIDTYVWKVKLKDFHGNPHSYTGVCNLIK